MAAINLNAKRKARAALAEKAGKPVPQHTVTLGDGEFTLPRELPAEFAFAASEGDLRRAITELFNGSAEAFFAERPSFNDVMELVQQVSDLYGFDDLGESPASDSSS